jgi:hypothetical protein
VGDEGDVPQVEGSDDVADDTGVLAQRVAVAGCRGGEPEAGIVDRDAAEVVAQRADDVAVEERPRGVAVQHQQHRPAALVDVVDVGGAGAQPPVGEGVRRVVDPARTRRHRRHPLVRRRAGLYRTEERRFARR